MNFKLTLKAWPVVTLLTIGLCFLTQQGAKLFGIDLPDQANLELVRKYLGFNRVFLLLCAQVLLLMPVVEELIFRWGLFSLVSRLASRVFKRGNGLTLIPALLSSALFSAAHYVFQPWPDAAFLALFFFGLAQCWIYRKTGRLWCAILNHALFNLTNLALLFVVPQA